MFAMKQSDMVSIEDIEVVISHGPSCNDGATAAWLIWRKFPPDVRAALAKEGGFYRRYSSKDSKDDKNFEESVSSFQLNTHPNSTSGGIQLLIKGHKRVIVFASPQEHIPKELVENRNVAILDLDLGYNLIPVIDAAKSVLIIDHHASSAKSFNLFTTAHKAKTELIYKTDKKHSACSLTWERFYEQPIPDFINTIRMGDTWDFLDSSVKSILRGMFVRRCFKNFEKIEETFNRFSAVKTSLVECGEIVANYEKTLVRMICEQAGIGYLTLKTGETYCVAHVNSGVLRSEVGASLKDLIQKNFEQHIQFVAVWRYVPHNNLVAVSLRSPDFGLDLSTIARNVNLSTSNGGGHAEAAGFSFMGIENFGKIFSNTKPSSPRATLIKIEDRNIPKSYGC